MVTVFLAAASLMPPPAAAQPKSAQNDCARAVASRGYSVISSRNFRQQPDGWQLDMQIRSPQGQLSSGSCYVRTSTGAVSLTGFDGTFGPGGGGGANMTFDCSSDGAKYRECQLPVDGRARLIKRYSKAPCAEGTTWGQRGDRVWVDRGCRARFEVVRGGAGGDGGQAGQQAAANACRTEAQRQYITVRSISAPQWRGSYWQAAVYGILRGQSVVADCRVDPRTNRAALFVQGGGAGPGTGVDLRVKAEEACMAQAKRLGFKVTSQSAAQAVPNGLRVALQIKHGNDLYPANCFYETRSGQATIEQVRPQPR
jgi:hypothetical protein